MELIKKSNSIYTLATKEGREAINNKIKEMNEENKDNFFYFAPTPEDIVASQNFMEFINKKQGLKKAIFLAIEKSRMYKNFTSNTTYSYIDRYMAKNNINSVYIIKAVHDFIYNIIAEQNGQNEAPKIKINGVIIEELEELEA